MQVLDCRRTDERTRRRVNQWRNFLFVATGPTYCSEMKIIGKRRTSDNIEGVSPEEALRRAAALQEQLELLNPYPKPRGFVAKFKTREAYEQWRKEQKNPRLW